MRQLIKSYSPIQAEEVPVEMTVSVKDPCPIVSRIRCLSPGNEDEVRQQIDFRSQEYVANVFGDLIRRKIVLYIVDSFVREKNKEQAIKYLNSR